MPVHLRRLAAGHLDVAEVPAVSAAAAVGGLPQQQQLRRVQLPLEQRTQLDGAAADDGGVDALLGDESVAPGGEGGAHDGAVLSTAAVSKRISICQEL